MTFQSFRILTAGVLAAALFLTAGRASAQVKKPEPPKKPDPVVIKVESAAKGKVMGEEVYTVTGADALTGQKRTFAVENRRPQNPRDLPKYDPNPDVKAEVDKVKPGEYLKIEPKAGGRWGQNYTPPAPSGGYGSSSAQAPTQWIDNAEPYTVTEHETEPGVFIYDGSFLDDLEADGQKIEVYSIELIKLGREIKCLAPMVPEGKKMVPDASIVAQGDELMKTYKEKNKSRNAPKMIIEATITQQGEYYFVTAMDAYQAPRTGTIVKVADADIDGQKGQSVEIEENGKSLTLLIPGKLVGKRWVTDSSISLFAKKAKPGTPVVFKTRDIDQKTFVRSLAPAPKEAKETTKKETAGK